MNTFFNENNPSSFHFIDFRRASPEAIQAILAAMNREVDEALLQGRVPCLNKVFEGFHPPSAVQ